MTGKRFGRRVASKREPLDVSTLDDAELWGVVLGSPVAGKYAAEALGGLTREQLADEGKLVRELQKWPQLYEARAGMIVAALAISGRTMRRVRAAGGRQLPEAA